MDSPILEYKMGGKKGWDINIPTTNFIAYCYFLDGRNFCLLNLNMSIGSISTKVKHVAHA